MRIVSKVITVIATVIVLVSVIWSIVIFSSPYEDSLIINLDSMNSADDQIETDARLYGSWQNAFQEVRFDADGSFDNEFDVDDEADEKSILLDDLKIGSYETKEKEIEFYDITLGLDAPSPGFSFNYYFENNDNYLLITNATNHSWSLSRNINRVRTYAMIVNYSNEKVNISGLFEYENETNGYLTLNETENETKVLIFFGDYNETNFTEFDGQNVSIIGYLYLTCDCDYWEGPCIKDIELIELTK